MSSGDKSKYTNKQKRKAEHIADNYEKSGVPDKVAEARAWATVNKDDGGGNKSSGSGYGNKTGNLAANKGGEKGGRASASRTQEHRSASAKKVSVTRKRNKEKSND